MDSGDVSLQRMEWVCAAQYCWRAGRIAPYLHDYLRALIPPQRLCRDVWARYRIALKKLPPDSQGVELHRIDTELFNFLSRHRERDENQFRSALRFWRLGFGEGYLWMDKGEPLCMQWLIKSEHFSARSGLGEWAGMYPPVGKNVGVVEAIYTFRKGLRRPGGAATLMALAVLHEGRKEGLTELRTQVHSGNIAAHRWAARLGWQRFGEVAQYSVDFRGLRGHYVYLHTREILPAARPELAPASAISAPSFSIRNQ